MRFAECRAKWLARRAELERLRAQVDGATLCEEVLADLDAISRAAENEVLTLSEASARTGLTAEHLGRLVRQGRIPNVGRRGAPRVRAGDIQAPGTRKNRVAASGATRYDPDADARSLMSRRGGQ